MFAVRALAMVDATSHARLRAVVTAPSVLSLRLQERDFVDAVRRGWPQIAVVDPTLVQGAGAIPDALRVTCTPTVLYIHLTPRHARAAMELLRVLAAEVLAYGYSDDVNALRSAAARSSRAARGRVLLDQLEREISRLPPLVRAGITAINTAGCPATSVAALACYCSTHRATLARAFAAANLGSVRDFLGALRIAQQFDIVTSDRMPVRAVAHQLGFASARALDRACHRLSGMRLAELRADVSLEQFCERAAHELRRVLTP